MSESTDEKAICMSYRRIAQIASVLATLSLGPAIAETAREVEWENLVPKAKEIGNPLDILTTDQQYELAIIARTRQLELEKQLNEDSTALNDAREFVRKLKNKASMLKTS